MTKLQDQFDRDQATEQLLDESVFIEAGAGTGKSTTLVSRIVNTIAREGSSATIESIAAITFTDKAGTELRNKLREKLANERALQPENIRIRQAHEHLDAASIGTIHSFAQTILREHALSANIPLGFTLTTEAEKNLAQSERVQKCIEELGIQADRVTLQTLVAYGVTMSTLRKLVSSLDDASLKLSSKAFATDGSEEFPELLIRTVTDLRSFYQDAHDSCTNTEDKLFCAIIPSLQEAIASLSLIDSVESLTTQILDYGVDHFSLPTHGRGGAQASWLNGSPADWKARYNTLRESYHRLISAPGEYALRRSLALVWKVLQENRDQSSKAGQLEFDDLLIATRDLLATNTEVRKYVHNQFRIVMVDEFQDTDPLQWEIIRLVTSDPGDSTHQPLPGHLVVVGDPKQAIYSFRGADVFTYIETRKQFGSEGENLGKTLALTTNFRAVKPVIEFVNSVFSKAIIEQLNVQVDYTELVPFHDPSDSDQGPAILVIRDPEPAADLQEKYEPSKMEPRQIAHSIAQAISQEWKVSELDEHHQRRYTRLAKFSDITILYPARTSRNSLLNALNDLNIPFRSTDAGLVYSRPVVKGLLAALRYAAEREPNLDLWIALKSPLFGYTDTDLLQFRSEKGNWYFSVDNPDLPVAQSLSALSDLSRSAQSKTPVELIDEIISVSTILEALPHVTRGTFEAECLGMVRAHAQDWQDKGGVGLFEYLQWTGAIIENASKVSLPEPDNQDDNAVRLMTMFQAKGLEFPIVAITGMSHAWDFTYPELIVGSREHYEFRVSKDFESADYSEWLTKKYKPQQEAEKTRLLYVACTRAQDHLILSLAGERSYYKKDGELSARLPYSYLIADSIPVTPEQLTSIPAEPNKMPLPEKDTFEQLSSDWIESVPNIQSMSGKRWVASPTGVGAQALGIDTAQPAPPSGETNIDSRPVSIPRSDSRAGSRDGTAIGQSVHRSLDVLVRENAPTAERISTVCAEFAAGETALDHIDTITLMVEQALASDTIAAAKAGSHLWTELYLSAPVQFDSIRIVDGIADLVYRDNQGLHIIDYKTDAVINEEGLSHYREQLQAYRELLSRATNDESISIAILHLSEAGSDLLTL